MLRKNVSGHLGSQLHALPCDSLNVALPQEMRYVWTLLRARGTKRSDGGKDVTDDFISSLHRALKVLATRSLCGTERRDNLPLIYTSFRPKLISPLVSLFDLVLVGLFSSNVTEDMFALVCLLSPFDATKNDDATIAFIHSAIGEPVNNGAKDC